MKTIIISDIENREKSIIPYALNFIKYLHPKTTVLHTVDPRKEIAASSAYADSQTFELGEKMSHKETIEREITFAHKKLDDILSYEASRLNFPLRTKLVVKKNTLQQQLLEEGGRSGNTLVLVSSVPDGKIIDGINEVFEIVERLHFFVLLIPAGMEFEGLSKAFTLFDFEKEKHGSLLHLLTLLNHFKLKFDIVDVEDNRKKSDLENKKTAWEKAVGKYFRPDGGLTTSILSGNDPAESINDYICSNDCQLVILPDGKDRDKFPKKLIRNLIKKLDLPILLYH